MAKFYGSIGYTVTSETSPGVWTETITERKYTGDITRNISRWSTIDQLNDDLNFSNEISIVADPFAYNHFHTMRYIHFMGGYWKITSIEPKYPRLILTIGGVYNGETAGVSSDTV